MTEVVIMDSFINVSEVSDSKVDINLEEKSIVTTEIVFDSGIIKDVVCDSIII